MKPSIYKEEEFIHFVTVKTGEFHSTVRKESELKLPKEDCFEVSFTQIENLNLNNKGKSIPFSRNNVVNLDRYMLKYWTPIIGSDAILLYLYLWEYCNQDQDVDICYPKIKDLATLMKKSEPTIRNLIGKLQDNNFLVCIRRLNKVNSNRETSPLFKLRQTIPLLSKEQYNKLPKDLQKKHDEYMQKFANEDDKMDYFRYDAKEVKNKLIAKGDKMISKKVRTEIDRIIQAEEDFDYLLSILPKDVKETMVSNDELMAGLESLGVSKPSREAFFKGATIFFIEDSKTAHIVFRDAGTKEFTKTTLVPGTQAKLDEFLDIRYGDVANTVMYDTVQYIYRTHKA